MNTFELGIENIIQHGWGRGKMIDPDTGTRCLLGAMEIPERKPGVCQNTPATRAMSAYLRENCEKCIRAERNNGHLPGIHLIWRHNDHHLDSQEDAILLLKELAHERS